MGDWSNELLLDCARRLRNSITIVDRSKGTFRRHIYHNCFIGKEAISKIVAIGAAKDRIEAQHVAKLMIKQMLIHSCSNSDRDIMKDGVDHFYRFACDKPVRDLSVSSTPFGPYFREPLLWRFPAHVKANSLFMTYQLAEKFEWALGQGTPADIADIITNVRKRMLHHGCFSKQNVFKMGEDPRFQDCEWAEVATDSKVASKWQLNGVQDRDFVVTRISGTLSLPPLKAIEMLAKEAGRKQYEPNIQKMETQDALVEVRRRVASESSIGDVAKPPVKARVRVRTMTTTKRGGSVLSYSLGLVNEALAKGDTVTYNKIKNATIRKFGRDTYSVYKEDVKEICRINILEKEKELIRRSSDREIIKHNVAPPPSPIPCSPPSSPLPISPGVVQKSPRKSTLGMVDKGKGLPSSLSSLNRLKNITGSGTHQMHIMSRSNKAGELITDLIIKYVLLKFPTVRWANRDEVVLRDHFSVADGRCVLWEMSVEHKECPQRDGRCRVTVHGNVYVAEPIPGQPGQCRLTRTRQVTYSNSNNTAKDIAHAEALFINMEAQNAKGGATDKLGRQTELIDFEVLSVLGKGGYGKVYQVRHKPSGEIYAMKSISKSYTVKKDQVDGVKAERNILSHVKHPYIVHMAWAFQTRASLYFVMEFVQGGDLLNLITKLKRGLPETLSRIYAAEIALGLAHLHKNGIVYRDMKPENILIGNDGHLKIADFGVSYVMDETRDDEGPKTFVGTEVYMAPEIIREAIKLQRQQGKQVRKARSSYGSRVDWWSYGIVFYEILTARHPFLSRDRLKTIKRIINPYQPKIKNVSNVAAHLVLGLLRREPDKRYGIKEIKRHPYFEKFDWAMLESNDMTIPDECLPEVLIAKAEEARKSNKKLKKKGKVIDKQLTKDLVNESVGSHLEEGGGADANHFGIDDDLFVGFDFDRSDPSTLDGSK